MEYLWIVAVLVLSTLFVQDSHIHKPVDIVGTADSATHPLSAHKPTANTILVVTDSTDKLSNLKKD